MFITNMLSLKNADTREEYLEEILMLNENIKDLELRLTRYQIKNILNTRDKTLQNYGRVELGIQVTKIIIDCFMDSNFITKENYIDTLNELHEIFYYLKNETEEGIGDYNLINLMKEYFENYCEGSLELLKSKLESFAREFRISGSMINREGI